MSQEDVLKIIKELGGEATTSEIRKCAKEKYPTKTLYLYVLNRLHKLEINDKIERLGEKWKIKK